MNHNYQHKKGPPKMIKDLKQGKNPHLRQSLLDESEIENLNKIFKGRKSHYKIEEQPIQISKEEQEEIVIHDMNFYSPQENLEMIKKQRVNNMMKDKMNSMFKEKEIRKYKMRKPVIYKMLEQFRNSYRVQDTPKFKEALKNSQMNLSHIKINNRKKISSQYVRGQSGCSRSKFVSIQSGKPIVNKDYFPTFENFLQGKYNQNQQQFAGIDFGRLNSQLMITEPSFVERKGAKKQNNFQFAHRTIQSKTRPDTSDFGLVKPKRMRSAHNPNKTFQKSQQSSKKMIGTMTKYYSCKKQKSTQCDRIVSYQKMDRPLTSYLRRKNYNIVGKTCIQDLNKYRERSQHQRVTMLKQNYNFYLGVLKQFESYRIDDIPQTRKILNKLKEFFESEYILLERDVRAMLNLDKQDIGIEILKQKLFQFAKKDDFRLQTEEGYEML